MIDSPFSWVALLALSAAFGAQACHKREKEIQAQFRSAEATFAEAERALAAGDVKAATRAYQSADAILHTLRLGATRVSADSLAAGPSYAGLSAAEWQARWKERFAQGIDEQFEVILAQSSAGAFNWADGRDFISQYGTRASIERWERSLAKTDGAAADRARDQLVLGCNSPEEQEYCDVLRRLIGAKLDRPLADSHFRSLAVDSAAIGIVDVTVEYRHGADYVETGRPDTSTPPSTASLPTDLGVRVTVTMNRGRSSWDGSHDYVVKAPAPEAIGAYSIGEMTRKQRETLKAKMQERLQGLEAQRISLER